MVNMNLDEELNKKTFIISTNNQGMLKFFDKVVLIDQGQIVHFDSFNKVKQTKEYLDIVGEAEEETEEEEPLEERKTIVRFLLTILETERTHDYPG